MVNTSCEKQSELIEHHSVLQFFVSSKYDEQCKCKKIQKVFSL